MSNYKSKFTGEQIDKRLEKIDETKKIITEISEVVVQNGFYTFTVTYTDGTEKDMQFPISKVDLSEEEIANSITTYLSENPVVKSEVEKYMQENPVKNGVDGVDGVDGKDGIGVESIEKTSTEGLVDTYTITLTNGNTSTFEVTNGRDGVDGKDGTNGTNGRDGVVTEEQNEKLNAIGNVETLTQNGFSDVISALFSLKEIIDNLTSVSIGEMKDNVITLYDLESGQYTFRYEDSNGNILEEFEVFSGKNEDYSLEV